MSTKQVIVVRKDLKMRKGKMIAQGAHASMQALLDGAPTISAQNTNGKFIMLSGALEEWLDGLYTKICVGVDSEAELLNIVMKAVNLGVRHSLVQDAGLTEFDGVPTYTAAAIGPAYSVQVDAVTGNLKLL